LAEEQDYPPVAKRGTRPSALRDLRTASTYTSSERSARRRQRSDLVLPHCMTEAMTLHLAGDSLRILGAEGAEVSGRLAATACLSDKGILARTLSPTAASGPPRKLRRRRGAGVSVAGGGAEAIARIRRRLSPLRGVTAATLRETVDDGGAEANRVKSFGRIGMGRCQGRYASWPGPN
jgi:hypothetical protein